MGETEIWTTFAEAMAARSQARDGRATQETSFSTIPTQEEDSGEDGETWILERVADGKHHVVIRWSAGYETEERGLTQFRAVCEWMFRMSGLNLDVTNKSKVVIPAAEL